jgi:DNA modification methylase
VEVTPYYQDESVTLYHGDCRDVLPGLAADCVVTSPPYNCGMDYGNGFNDSRPLAEYWSWFEDCYYAIATATRPGGFVCLNVPSWIGSRADQVFAFDEYKTIADRHLEFCDLVIWAKSPPNGTAWGNYPNSPRIRANHEWVLIHRAFGGPIGNSDISWQDWSRLTQSVWPINPTLPFGKDHPATFPSALPARLALLFSPAGATVLDPFMGTGTTGASARRIGRNFIGIEQNERYCELAARRLSQGSLDLDVLVGDAEGVTTKLDAPSVSEGS